ncbi:UNVERIFIED_CONTAM: hypothetical protein Scaly_2862900 [Sesamum calycinum]|uniref:R3H domain-containing protein n=1 Tax=Sesamum calycinum TaxID=2727403 RepID=A0AAW2LGG9_9LAMI
MNSYNRLLIHRLAEIFGFSHQSVGEGEDRHLILERCPESSIPPILVTDLLWQSGEVQSPQTFDVLSREKVIPGQRDNSARECSLEERETTYLAARQRIFSAELYQTELVKQRPRNDPVVARRMITRALGKTNKVVCHVFSSSDTKEYGPTANDWNIQQVDEATICSSNKLEGKSLSAKHPITCTLSEVHKSNGSELSSSSKEAKQKNLVASGGGSASEQKENSIAENHLQKEIWALQKGGMIYSAMVTSKVHQDKLGETPIPLQKLGGRYAAPRYYGGCGFEHEPAACIEGTTGYFLGKGWEDETCAGAGGWDDEITAAFLFLPAKGGVFLFLASFDKGT